MTPEYRSTDTPKSWNDNTVPNRSTEPWNDPDLQKHQKTDRSTRNVPERTFELHNRRSEPFHPVPYYVRGRSNRSRHPLPSSKADLIPRRISRRRRHFKRQAEFQRLLVRSEQITTSLGELGKRPIRVRASRAWSAPKGTS